MRPSYSFYAKLKLALVLSTGGIFSCITVIKPSRDFARYPSTASPDYAQAANWAALPERRDSVDTVPYGTTLRDQQNTAAADVFFVHPTTYYSRASWNASLQDKQVNLFTDRNVMRKQASVFNAAGRIYAPRYRQATLFSFFDEHNGNGKKALGLAYGDVKAAFQYYLAHYNQGRPIIIASHSQGTVHATQLLHDFFDNNPALRKQLVAAYLIGYHVKANEYQAIRPCQDSTQTGCYISWNAVEWGKEFAPFEGGVATNPLTWQTDTIAAPATANLGGVPQAFNRIDTHVADAKVHNGLVWIHPPTVSGYPRFLLPGQPELRASFHIADYSLFYLNLRRNAVTRVEAWRKQP
ncbi:DUF3089 domain-containing protein [Hymenobacter sp. GOD-10R]|uniref:DUF3089 domain-containing protein n=1 Tax=Hymenobacter sp. GOD-10R TaxID=3093922 RepID=UPI002D76B923|nr:DUF3089 domain-containing protein [Hymenobacter sp. GOD-10R]WRQ29489.1 DUF3089 domain-containing protein [Hymenobacter sp. GOD-10R]